MGKWICLLAITIAGLAAAGALHSGAFHPRGISSPGGSQNPAVSDAGRRRLAYAPQEHARQDAPEPEFRPRDVVPPFPVIREVPIEPAETGDTTLSPRELVLGVQIGDHARAYPINMLCGPRREIINDTVGGRAIAATW